MSIEGAADLWGACMLSVWVQGHHVVVLLMFCALRQLHELQRTHIIQHGIVVDLSCRAGVLACVVWAL